MEKSDLAVEMIKTVNRESDAEDYHNHPQVVEVRDYVMFIDRPLSYSQDVVQKEEIEKEIESTTMRIVYFKPDTKLHIVHAI